MGVGRGVKVGLTPGRGNVPSGLTMSNVGMGSGVAVGMTVGVKVALGSIVGEGVGETGWAGKAEAADGRIKISFNERIETQNAG